MYTNCIRFVYFGKKKYLVYVLYIQFTVCIFVEKCKHMGIEVNTSSNLEIASVTIYHGNEISLRMMACDDPYDLYPFEIISVNEIAEDSNGNYIGKKGGKTVVKVLSCPGMVITYK